MSTISNTQKSRGQFGIATSFPLLPASFFGIPLGIGGLASEWRAAHLSWGAPTWISDLLFACAAAVWAPFVLLFVAKWLFRRSDALEEADHPIRCCFIGLVGVATLIIAQGALSRAPHTAIWLYVFGSVFTFAFGVWRTGTLWHGSRESKSNTSVLFLPVVAGGFVIAGTTGALGFPEWATLAFGAAFFTWLATESVILHRLYTGPEMPAELRPTLGIQLAPPAVGALAYLSTGADGWSVVPQAMIGYALLQAALLIRLWPWIAERGFAPSVWAVTFGATALPTALIKVSATSPTAAFYELAVAAFVASNAIIATIAAFTIWHSAKALMHHWR